VRHCSARAPAATNKYGAIAIGFNVETVQVNKQRRTSAETMADISPVQKYQIPSMGLGRSIKHTVCMFPALRFRPRIDNAI